MIMIKATPLYMFVMAVMMLLLNACTTSLPQSGARRDPIQRLPNINPPIISSRPRARPPAVTKPYKPIQKRIRTRPRPERRPTVLIRPADKAEVGKNPYDSVPQSGNGSQRSTGRGSASSAVNALLLQAKVDVIARRYETGASKLERALRISPRNAQVWSQLARVNYKQKKYASSITMAQKSNRYTSAGSELEKANWVLIRKASKASGDITTLKKAIRYERFNP